MFGHRLIALLLLSWAGLVNRPLLRADDQKPSGTTPAAKATAVNKAAWRNAQRLALQKMRSKKEEGRTDAIDALKEFPTVECAKLLVLQGMASQYDDVRKAAYATLASFRDSDDVCKYLLTSVEKDATKGMPNETTYALFAVPLSSTTPEIEKQAFDLFEKTATQRKGGMLLLVSLADRLGAAGDETSIATLVKISQRPIFKEQFAVRRSVVQALNKIDESEAVDALINILGRVEGEVRGDIVQHLTGISGEKFGMDPPAWEKWWKANRENFKFEAVAARAVNRAEAVRSRSMYHGLPIYASRLVFVIDTSGSMQGEPIMSAKTELVNAVNALPEGVYFNVLAFAGNVRYWQRKLAVASDENKKTIARWIEGQGAGGGTASYDALEAALDLDAEAIYFLTDGAPRGGKVDIPAQIVELITRLNHTRRLTINCIGFGRAQMVPTDFLEDLAERNYGEYRAVAFGE
ncbi:MAG: VWA domain-containing protein [Pirellulales bacterium]